jgi:hypothetical protein
MAPAAVLFLADDLLDLLQHPQAQRQPGIDAGGLLPDHARAQHQRCETISASFGFSFRMGRKNRDNRMRTLKESGDTGCVPVKPDRLQKHKGGVGKAATTADYASLLQSQLILRLRR